MDLSVDTWDRVFAVNARGVFLGCKHAVPLMHDSDGGSIINIASIRAWLGTSRAQDAYAATKGAVVALTRSLAVHLAPRQIRANTISPGTVLTAMAPLPDEAAVAQRLARYPLGRFGETPDVVGAAVFLASDESRWVTGADLRVDGGTSVFYV
jgi:cyclopentanol dehydrogenase